MAAMVRFLSGGMRIHHIMKRGQIQPEIASYTILYNSIIILPKLTDMISVRGFGGSRSL
jgi:hypothetical protein